MVSTISARGTEGTIISGALKSLLPLLALCLCVGVPKLPLRLWLATAGVSNRLLLLLLPLEATDEGVCVVVGPLPKGPAIILQCTVMLDVSVMTCHKAPVDNWHHS